MRKVIVLVVMAAAAAAAVLGATRAWATYTARTGVSGFKLLPPAAPAGQFVEYGHIRKLTRSGKRYVVRFDPAWFTSGVTASAAHKEDTGSSEVPNDNYVVEEGHRLLTYRLPASARVTVLTNRGASGITATPIPVAELARIVNGGPHRKLFEPLASGVWIRVRIDTVLELDQQYQP
jgi:hypothetical protein